MKVYSKFPYLCWFKCQPLCRTYGKGTFTYYISKEWVGEGQPTEDICWQKTEGKRRISVKWLNIFEFRKVTVFKLANILEIEHFIFIFSLGVPNKIKHGQCFSRSRFSLLSTIHCIKYARIPVFIDPYSPVQGLENTVQWKLVLLHILCSDYFEIYSHTLEQLSNAKHFYLRILAKQFVFQCWWRRQWKSMIIGWKSLKI